MPRNLPCLPYLHLAPFEIIARHNFFDIFSTIYYDNFSHVFLRLLFNDILISMHQWRMIVYGAIIE
jgi:hypothetical protein